MRKNIVKFYIIALLSLNCGLSSYAISDDAYINLKRYTEIISNNPQGAKGYTLRGLLYYSQYKDYEKAINDFNYAIKYNPNDPRLYLFRGLSKKELENYSGALPDLTKAISMYNNKGTPQALAYCTRAVVYLMLGNNNASIEDSTQAIKLQPKYPLAFFTRAEAKLNIYGKQNSISGVQSAIQDFYYAKEQYSEMGNMSEYQRVMERYNEATEIKKSMERKLSQ